MSLLSLYSYWLDFTWRQLIHTIKDDIGAPFVAVKYNRHRQVSKLNRALVDDSPLSRLVFDHDGSLTDGKDIKCPQPRCGRCPHCAARYIGNAPFDNSRHAHTIPGHMGGYSLYDYGRMIGDPVRMTAYVAALRRAIRPGAVVVDVGCGPGLFALLAARLGAARVHAIEPAPVIEVARALAQANGLADRITFWPVVADQVTLPEAADVILSDLRGALPLYRRHLPAMMDARQRFLKPGGRLIPQTDTLWVAPVQAPDLYAQYTAPWQTVYPDLDLRAAGQLAVNAPRVARAGPEWPIAPPQAWATLDYPTLTTGNVAGQARWTLAQSAQAHGLLIWFSTRLLDEIGFSNAPDQPPAIYKATFFPWERPLTLAADDILAVRLAADLMGDDYIWRWETRHWRGGQLAARLEQSTFHAVPLGRPGEM